MMAPGLSFPALLHPLFRWRRTLMTGTTKGITRGTDTTTGRTKERLAAIARVMEVDLLQPVAPIRVKLIVFLKL
jgi:hypothetical protein